MDLIYSKLSSLIPPGGVYCVDVSHVGTLQPVNQEHHDDQLRTVFLYLTGVKPVYKTYFQIYQHPGNY